MRPHAPAGAGYQPGKDGRQPKTEHKDPGHSDQGQRVPPEEDRAGQRQGDGADQQGVELEAVRIQPAQGPADGEDAQNPPANSRRSVG